MKRRIKESKNIFPCTVYIENQDYDEAYYYLDTPEYGLSWRSFDDVEQEDVENYKYIIKNTADLRKAIDDLEEDFIYGYGAKYFKLSGNYMEDLLNRGKTLVHVSNVDSKDTVFIIKVKPAQNVELVTVKESTEDNTETGVFVVTDFSDDSYKNPKVKRVKIADGVTTIKEDAFFNCKNLTEVIIPDSVTSIGNDAFENCKNLKTIHYAGTKDQWNAIEKAFDWIAGTQKIMIDYNYQESSTFDESSVELALAESFEKTIKNLQKEGLFENVSSFDLDFTGRGINIKLNESRPGNRNASFKKRSNLRENESDESKYPFTDLILFSINRYHDVCDFWPTLRSVSANEFYGEVSEQTGMDYDDVKDYCWDMAPDTPTIDEIFNELVYMGSEKYLSEKYGTLENLQKVIDKDDADTEAAYEEFANRFDSLFDGELENEYKEAVDYAVADLEARFNRDDEDDDDEYSDED